MYLLFLSDFNATWISSRDFRKNTHTTFHENSSNGVPVVPCGQTDITKLTVCFRSFAKAPRNSWVLMCAEGRYALLVRARRSAQNFCRELISLRTEVRWRSLGASLGAERVDEQKDAKGTVYTRRNCADWGQVATLLPRMSIPNLGISLDWLYLARWVSNLRVTYCPQHSAM